MVQEQREWFELKMVLVESWLHVGDRLGSHWTKSPAKDSSLLAFLGSCNKFHLIKVGCLWPLPKCGWRFLVIGLFVLCVSKRERILLIQFDRHFVWETLYTWFLGLACAVHEFYLSFFFFFNFFDLHSLCFSFSLLDYRITLRLLYI